MNLKHIRITMAVFMSLTTATWLYAGEHPEHPATDEKEHPDKEHKEHPEGKTTPISKESLAEAIEEYVEQDAALKGGYFLVYDKEQKNSLILELEKVHKERLSKIGEDVYFACADFKTPQGKIYDLDIFMQGPDKEHLKVTEVAVHKEDGKPRYTWYEEEGIWKKKPAGAR